MAYPIFFAVMAAAMLHATWNALVKTGESKQTAMAILTVMQSMVGIVVVCFRPWPEAEVWPWLIASGLIHMCYQFFLAYAYEQGDLSRVYPIARGVAPMVVLAFSLVFLTNPIAMMDYVGIVVLGLGIALMARGIFANDESRRLLPPRTCIRRCPQLPRAPPRAPRLPLHGSGGSRRRGCAAAHIATRRREPRRRRSGSWPRVRAAPAPALLCCGRSPPPSPSMVVATSAGRRCEGGDPDGGRRARRYGLW